MKVARILVVCFVVFGVASLIFFYNYKPPKFDLDAAIEKGNLVDLHGEQYNIEKLDKFVENFKNGKPDSILIVNLTVEGDPILNTVKYDGKVIRLTEDNSRDRFGGTIFKRTSKFNSIEVVEKDRYTEYDLVKDSDTRTIFIKFYNK